LSFLLFANIAKKKNTRNPLFPFTWPPPPGQNFSMKPKPAAAVILLRDSPEGPQVLLAKRSPTSPFMPSRHVFPGGNARPGERPEFAAIRELWEEAGVVLAKGRQWPEPTVLHTARSRLAEANLVDVLQEIGLRPAVEDLAAYSVWTTPSARPIRFQTTFFLALLPPGQEPSPDGTEVVELVWKRPAQALEENTAGRLHLGPPQVRILAELSVAESAEELMGAAASGQLVHVSPVMWTGKDGVRVVLLPWDKDYPLGRPSCPVLGRPVEPLRASRIVCIAGQWLPYAP